jgi:hypothetical protein
MTGHDVCSKWKFNSTHPPLPKNIPERHKLCRPCNSNKNIITNMLDVTSKNGTAVFKRISMASSCVTARTGTELCKREVLLFLAFLIVSVFSAHTKPASVAAATGKESN